MRVANLMEKKTLRMRASSANTHGSTCRGFVVDVGERGFSTFKTFIACNRAFPTSSTTLRLMT